MHRTLRRLALVAASCLVVSSPSLFEAASAETSDYFLTGNVYDEDQSGLPGIDVYVLRSGSYVKVATTSTNGYFRAPRTFAVSGPTEVAIVDDAGEYAPTNVMANLDGSTEADIGAVLDKGSTVSGVVRTPSGQVVSHAGVLVARGVTNKYRYSADYAVDTTTSNGRFEAWPVGLGVYHLYVGFDDYKTAHGDVTVNDEGSAVSQDITGIKVPATIGLSVASHHKRQVTFRMSVDAKRYGVILRDRKVTIYDGTHVFKSKIAIGNGVKTLTLSGIPKGKHAYRIKYLGGTDGLVGPSVVRKVTVK